jgi:hypothetical protein
MSCCCRDVISLDSPVDRSQRHDAVRRLFADDGKRRIAIVIAPKKRAK